MVASRESFSFIHEPFEKYRENAKHYLSSHQLGDFRKCPQLYHKKKQGLIPDEDRPAFLFGRAAHTLILEGRSVLDQQYAVGGPINPKTGEPFGASTKAFAEWAEKIGKPVLTSEQYDLLFKLRAASSVHPLVTKLLTHGTAENVVRTDYYETACQIRMDWFNPAEGIVDLKTCDDLTWFEHDARRFGYLHQLAFYRAVLTAATGVEHRVFLIAVEKKEPYRCGVWSPDSSSLDAAQRENEEAMDRLKQCQTSGVWPTGYEELRTLELV
ncbi:PD-(D/E)XK nuclease-like domain-containing protein [Oscillatoria laete-virens NRMC-F 0139]|nr:PD-(D/E)XK nuclease-like domain-containing protein [Oscillatoria laete-virens]MDL5053332.1 PD-(D/E)XK nuclease-like domain-containing protein [Oscillatoria laete-virens NRMC-F 0139]